MSDKIRLCSCCGQWAVFCVISQRYHCEECNNWASINLDMNLDTSKATALKVWNEQNKEACYG